MRVLHAPTNVGNQAWVLSTAERELGLDSRVLVYQTHIKGYGSDFDLEFEKRSKVDRLVAATKFFLRSVKSYDIFHFYFLTTFFPLHIDLPILSLLKKKMVFTFQGCDIRPGYLCPAAKHYPNHHRHRPVSLQASLLRLVQHYASKSYVVNPDLLDVSPSSQFLPYASVSITKLSPKFPAPRNNKEMVIVHAPSDPLVKGTPYIVAAVDRLRREGHNIRLDLITGVSHHKVLQHLQRADLVVDQLLMGWYGGFAVEAMALGKPTIARVEQRWVERAQLNIPIPIIRAGTQTIYQEIKNYVERPEIWGELGRQSRAFVEQVHDPLKIAQRVIKDYQRLLNP